MTRSEIKALVECIFNSKDENEKLNLTKGLFFFKPSETMYFVQCAFAHFAGCSPCRIALPDTFADDLGIDSLEMYEGIFVLEYVFRNIMPDSKVPSSVFTRKDNQPKLRVKDIYDYFLSLAESSAVQKTTANVCGAAV